MSYSQLGRWKWPLTLGIAGVLLGGAWWLGEDTPRPAATALPLLALTTPIPTLAPTLAATTTSTTAPTTQPTAVPATPTSAPLVVYVSGAVSNPGVYRLAPDARADDAVRAAGGLLPNADAVRINLAARLHDEQQIYVPLQGEATLAVTAAPSPALPTSTAPAAAPAAATPTSVQTVAASGKINLNPASLADLEQLPRIGPATAQRILEYREANGPFASIEAIQEVKGIGPATFDQIKDLITVEP